MIPKTAEYALRAVVVLARQPQRACSAEQIAEATRVPRRYAHKVLQALVRAELVRSQSGRRLRPDASAGKVVDPRRGERR